MSEVPSLRDDELDGGLDGGLGEAFKDSEGESVLGAIERIHGVGSSVLLRDAAEDASPVMIRPDDGQLIEDDCRYLVLGELARGGIGVVFKGLDRDLNREIALKVLRPEYADREDVVQRFVEEAQVGGQLQHPGIVPVYGIGLQPDGRPSFAMKLIKGKTLADLLDDNPRGVDLMAVFEQIAQTMAYAHSRGVIHRDLKPANIMIGAFGEVQVVDWGFAKVLGQDVVAVRPMQTIVATVRSGGDGSQSIMGDVMGTPGYMPPEQAMGRIDDLDERSDVFALGAILCELLTGSAPYTGAPKDQLISAMQCLLDEAYERLDAASVAVELKQLVRDCMKPRTADRPASAQVVAERLAQHLASVDDRARQSELDALAASTKIARERRGRRRALVLSSVLLVAVIACGGAYLWWTGERDTREAGANARITAALREATRHEGELAWPLAVAAAQRAIDVAASEGVDDAGAGAMLERLERARDDAKAAAVIAAEDDAFLAELDDISDRIGQGSAQASMDLGSFDAGGASKVFGDFDLGRRQTAPAAAAYDVTHDYRIADAACVAAFRRRFDSVEASATRLAASRHAPEFAMHLNEWSGWLHSVPPSGPGREVLVRLVREIDPGHADVFAALEAIDNDAVMRIARTRGDELPLGLARIVAFSMLEAGHDKEAVAYLTRQQRRAPGEFRINLSLGLLANEAGRRAQVRRTRGEIVPGEDCARAARHFSAALAVRPSHATAWTYLGMASLNMRDHTNASAAARRGVELNPGDAFARMILGRSLSMGGDLDGAIVAFRRAVELSPKRYKYDAYKGLADALIEKGDLAGAIAVGRTAIESLPEEARAHRLFGTALTLGREPKRALEPLRRAIELDPKDAWAYALLGSSLLDIEDRVGGIAAMRKFIELEPDHGPARRLLGNTLAQHLRDYVGAALEYRKAIELGAGNADLYARLGSVLALSGDFDGAVAAHGKAIELDPRSATARTRYGGTLSNSGDLDGAIEQLNRAIELDPRHAQAYQFLGITLNKKGDFGGARAACRKWIEMEPSSSAAHYNLAQMRRQRGDLDGAHASLRRAMALHRGFVGRFEHQGLLADLLQYGGDADGAVAAARRGVELAPGAATAHSQLALSLWLTTRRGKPEAFEEALAAVRKGIELDPRDGYSHQILAWVLFDTGDVDAALTAARRALALPFHYGSREKHVRAIPRYERAVAAKPFVARVLAGERVELPPLELTAVADLLNVLGHHERAAEVYARAFAADSKRELTTDAADEYLRSAARAAARAGGRWRTQAVTWLRAHVELIRRGAAHELPKDLMFLTGDPELSSIRDAKELPEDAKKLWKDIEALLLSASRR